MMYVQLQLCVCVPVELFQDESKTVSPVLPIEWKFNLVFSAASSTEGKKVSSSSSSNWLPEALLL